MNWKEILKPDSRKIILFVILLYFFLTISYSGNECLRGEGASCADKQGFPFAYYSSYQSMASINRPTITSSNYYAIIPDVLFWYIVSAIVISVYDKFKTKN